MPRPIYTDSIQARNEPLLGNVISSMGSTMIVGWEDARPDHAPADRHQSAISHY